MNNLRPEIERQLDQTGISEEELANDLGCNVDDLYEDDQDNDDHNVEGWG